MTKSIVGFTKRIFEDESGASATEYAILITIVAAAVAATVGVLTGGMEGLFSALSSKMVNSYIT